MMNPAIQEEIGQTARGIVDALKAQPAVLSLTIANFALLAFIFYALHGAADFRDKLIGQMFDVQRTCSTTQKLLH